MRRYETTYILRPNLGEDQISEIIERTNGIIESFDGSIIQEDRWGLKKLAYEIKKESQGYYVFSDYAATGDAVDEIERIFRIDDQVLRYLTIKLSDAIDTDGVSDVKEQLALAEAEKAKAEEEEASEEQGETETTAKASEKATEE